MIFFDNKYVDILRFIMFGHKLIKLSPFSETFQEVEWTCMMTMPNHVAISMKFTACCGFVKCEMIYNM